MRAEGEKSLALSFYVMDPTVISAIIAGAAMILVNVVSNLILSNRQTALFEYRIKQLEDSLSDIKALPERVTILETRLSIIDESLKELRT